jgi:hypothetical protein
MSNEITLKRALENAYNGGYNPDPDNWPLPLSAYDWKGLVVADRYYAIIFSHDFAKAFWGDEDWTEVTYTLFADSPKGRRTVSTEPKLLKAWQYYLQEMVLEENSLQFLAQLLDIN